MNTALTPLRKEKGVVLVLVALSLFLLMGMAGLALDLSHAYLNKTRLQNAVDAAALAGANVLNIQLAALSGTPTSEQISAAKANAITKIKSVFSLNTGNNPQLNTTIPALNPPSVGNIEFSDTLFGSDTGTPLYVRVTSPTVTYPTWFMQAMVGIGIIGQNAINVRTTAVAGITPISCANNLVPIMLCAKANKGIDADGNLGGTPGGTWGYTYNRRIQLDAKFSGNQPSGNFMFLDTGGSNSANVLRDQLAGAGSVNGICAGSTPTIVGTNPGAMTGPTADGLNTRFGIYEGNYKNNPPTFGPADTNVNCYDFALNSSTSQNNYINGVTPGNADPNGAGNNLFCNQTHPVPSTGPKYSGRRFLSVPIADCDGTHGGIPVGNGNTKVSVLDLGCLFLDVPADYSGQTSQYCDESPNANPITGCTKNQQEISARFVPEGCNVTGTSSNTGGSFALKTVQLYKNPGSPDS
jgi:Flp pilus assembly protein TadG